MSMATAKSGTNWFVVGVTAAVVVALVAVGALVVWLNNQATAPGPAPAAANINSETGAISFGDGPEQVATYVDFLCPHCASFEAQFGEQLAEAAETGAITLDVHPVAIMDHAAQGTEYSSRAASAMYCVAAEAPDAALDYMQLLFTNQASALSLDNAALADLADQVGAGAAAECIDEGRYVKFAKEKTKLTPPNANGQIGTPTVAINGERVELDQVTTIFADILP